MEYTILSIILNVLMGLGMWAFKNSFDNNNREVKRLSQELKDVQINYVKKEELKELKVELRDMFKEFKDEVKELVRPHQ